MDELLEILEALRPDVDFDREEHLVEDGILDSFDIVSIVAELDGALGVRIGAEELVPENFNSARALWALVRRHRG
ncbi:MAG: acyl carrier protein [Faecousia sp.]